MNRPIEITVVPPNIHVMMTGACRATQPAKGTIDDASPVVGSDVTLYYTDGTTETVNLGAEFSLNADLDWFRLVSDIQNQRSS